MEEILRSSPLWPSKLSENTQGKGTKIKFDYNINSDNNTIIIEPSHTIKASPEFIEWAKQMKEESQKPVTGLFDTELEVKQADSGVELVFSLHNVSEETLKLNFDVGREFDFFVANTEGEEVYRWSYGKEKCLAAISHNKLKKGEKLIFSKDWDYTDNEGSKVSPGKYTIKVKMLPKLENGKSINPGELTATKDIEVYKDNL